MLVNDSGKRSDKLLVLLGVGMLLPQPGFTVCLCVDVWPEYVAVCQRDTGRSVSSG